MNRWDKLFEKVQTEMGSDGEPDPALAATEQADSTPQQQAPDAVAFEQWCMRTTLGVMEAIHERVLQRSGEFEQHTGKQLAVVYPSEAPAPHLVYAAREMHFMKLALDGIEIHLYSARNPNKLPALHTVSESEPMVPSIRGTASRPRKAHDFTKQRVVSTPLCRVAATRDAGYQLVSTKDGSPLKLDTVVFQIFERLMRQRRAGGRS